MSNYESLRTDYKRIAFAIDEAICKGQAYDELVNQLLGCLMEIEETPEVIADNERIFQPLLAECERIEKMLI